MEKVLIADFSSGKDRVTVRGLWQFDRGVKLKVIGINVADVNRVDFAPVVASEAVPVVVVPDEDGTFTVSIPGTATKSPYDVTAYIYVDTAEYGYTVKAVSMPVILRPEAGKPGEEEKPDPFGEVVEKVSGYAKEARDSARVASESEKAASESATQAEKAKEASKESAEKAAESKEAAATSATDAAESASQARESAAESETAAAQQAENAAQSVTAASGSAESAAQSAETAKTAADTAEKSASAAQQAARSAAESASTATAAAQTATTAAGKADESVMSAAQSAETAGQKATAAETAAGSAAESETEAAKSATAAGDSASAAKTSETAAEEAAQTAQEQAEKIVESAEQIAKNKAGVDSLKEDLASKADKTSLAQTDRKLDALWKLNQGVSYQFEEDSAEAYQKTVPTGAKLASVKSIGGKTIVWNQLFENKSIKTTTVNGVTFTNNGDGSYTVDGTATDVAYVSGSLKIVKNHKYYMKSLTGPSESYKAYITGTSIFSIMTDKGKGYIDTALSDGTGYFVILYAKKDTVVENVKIIPMVFDLTKMFGSGNEPATVEEFEAMFPADYYPYNAGELRSACVSEVVEQGKNLLDASNITDVDVDGKGSIRQGVIIPAVKGTYKISALKAENNIFVKRVVGNNYATPADLSSKEVSLTFDANGSIYVYATDGKIEGVQVEKGSVVTQYSSHHKNTYPVPEAVRQLPGYGWSAGDVYNEIDFENKKYIQRVAAIDFGKLTFAQYDPTNHTKHTWYAKVSNMRPTSAKLTCTKYTQHSWISIDDKTFLQGIIQSHPSLNYIYINDDDYTNASDFSKAVSGVMLYYELAEPIITDISDLTGDAFQEPFSVEPGGTLTFKNSNGDGFQIPVPNTEEYIVKLSEVTE
ncbi:hypothetical protein KE540_01245 [Lachnospiraceae bacterium Marseille-Q4251]|nr:hypothetical protein [Lachnospiraceae bacterium Marseille-Q4251]